MTDEQIIDHAPNQAEMIQQQWDAVGDWIAKTPVDDAAMRAAKTSVIIGMRMNCDQWAQLAMSLGAHDSVRSHEVVATLGVIAERCSEEIDARIPPRGSDTVQSNN